MGSQEDIEETSKLIQGLEEANQAYKEAIIRLEELNQLISLRQKELEQKITDIADQVKWSALTPEYLQNFVEEPFVIEPSKINKKGDVIEWKVFVPKFVKFHIGRLVRTTHSFNVFTVNQYMRWFAELPESLLARFPQPNVDLKVYDGLLITSPDKTEEVWAKYREHLSRREGPGQLRIKKGGEWSLISQILEDGGLPFTPQPINENDMRPPSNGGFALHPDWEMRSYQKEALELFLEYGAVGIYWPFGCGKSEFGLHLCDILRGPKLIIAGGSRSLKEQWMKRLESMPDERREECHVVVYQSRSEIDRLIKKFKEFTLVIFDECHHLPAKTFIRLSTIPTKYRIGLTGSPYREDGKINYIIALTGYPHGLAWGEFVASGVISLAEVQVHVVRNLKDKLTLLDDMLKRDLGKTLIFCDSLDLGDSIARKYKLPWIHGATRNRIDKLEKNERIVISRVGDEGISLPELDTIIEINFMGGSRAQALQRAGRLQHRSLKLEKEPAIHHILVTEEELEKFGKRIWAYFDKGYHVVYIHHKV